MIDLTPTISTWPEPAKAAIVATSPARSLGRGGDTSRVSSIASLSKLFVAITCLVAVEEGSIELDEPAGRHDATVRHLLAHAAGYSFDQPGGVTPVEQRRVYSNTGFEVLASHLANRTGVPFADYQREAIIEPLGLTHTKLRGSPAAGIHSNVDDLTRFAKELLTPTLLHPQTIAEATRVQFGNLRGVLPGWGRFDPLPWGLGFELKGDKTPHWSGSLTSPETFGHFGASGTYLFVEPQRRLAVVAVSGTPFGQWAITAWPKTNDAVTRSTSWPVPACLTPG